MTFIIWPKFIMISEKIDRKFLFRLVSKAITISEKDSCVFFYWILLPGISVILSINLLMCSETCCPCD